MGTHLGVGYLLRVACACLSVEQLRGLITTVFSLPGPCLFRADGVMVCGAEPSGSSQTVSAKP